MTAPELVLLYDCETNGTDPQTDLVIEAAGMLLDVRHASPVAAFSFCMKAESNAALPINGIPATLLVSRGIEQGEAWKRVGTWMSRADAVVAHNASFDRSFCPGFVQALKPWVCTQDDVDWPRASSSQGLVPLLLAHGLGVSHAHRALVDVMNIARLFERCQELGHSADQLLARAMRPKKRYKAVTGRFDPAANARYKEAGFRWEPETKEWWRRLAVEDVPQLQAKYPFAIVEADR